MARLLLFLRVLIICGRGDPAPTKLQLRLSYSVGEGFPLPCIIKKGTAPVDVPPPAHNQSKNGTNADYMQNALIIKIAQIYKSLQKKSVAKLLDFWYH